MKKLYTLTIGMMLLVRVFAQAPEKISYQAVIRDLSNKLITNQGVGMQISILQGGLNGTVVYTEVHSPTTNVNGLVSIEIGTGTVMFGAFNNIDWANNTFFIKTETDPSTVGGIAYTITGITQLLSVPYALHAKTADSISGPINFTESDPLYSAWDKSTGITITESQITDLTHTVDTDTQLDSVGIANYGYVAGGITSESDPLYSAWDKSTGITITESQITDLTHTVDTDTQLDSVGIANYGYVAGGITSESDPLYSAWDKSTGITITESQITDLTHTVDTDTQLDSVGIANYGYVAGGITSESDPLYSAWDKSTGITITESQITDLTHTVDTDTQLDSVGIANYGYVAGGITSESDPLYSAWDKSTGITITESQITDLTHTVDTDTQLDSVGIANYGYVAGGITSESDPLYSAWDKSTGITITESQITDLTHTVDTDTQLDSVGIANYGYVAGGITSESDPLYSAWDKSTGITITESQITDLTHTVDTDTQLDSVGIANYGYVAGGITSESDPLYSAWDKSTGITITESQITDLTHTVDTDTQLDSVGIANYGYVAGGITSESDPLYSAWDKSTGITITESQITDLTHTVDTDTQLDSVGIANYGYVAGGITSESDPLYSAWDKSTGITITESQITDLTHTVDTDTQLDETAVDAFVANNGYLTSFTEVDGSITNELQMISRSGSTVTLSNGGGSFTDSVNVYSAGNGIDITNNVISVNNTSLTNASVSNNSTYNLVGDATSYATDLTTSITLSSTSDVLIAYIFPMYGRGGGWTQNYIYVNGIQQDISFTTTNHDNDYTTNSGTFILNLGPGTHTIELWYRSTCNNCANYVSRSLTVKKMN